MGAIHNDFKCGHSLRNDRVFCEHEKFPKMNSVLISEPNAPKDTVNSGGKGQTSFVFLVSVSCSIGHRARSLTAYTVITESY